MLVYLFKVIMDILYAFHIEQRFPINMHITFRKSSRSQKHRSGLDYTKIAIIKDIS